MCGCVQCVCVCNVVCDEGEILMKNEWVRIMYGCVCVLKILPQKELLMKNELGKVRMLNIIKRRKRVNEALI